MRKTLVALSLTAMSLAAQDVKVGVQAQVNLPMGDLKTIVDSKVGPGAGVHAQFNLGSGMAIRPRADFNTWSNADVLTVTNKVSNLTLGGDFLYFVEGKATEGVFFLGGLSAVKWSYEKTEAGLKRNYDTTKMGLSFGVGYQWNATFGTEARYTHASMGYGNSGDTLSLGATLKF